MATSIAGLLRILSLKTFASNAGREIIRTRRCFALAMCCAIPTVVNADGDGISARTFSLTSQPLVSRATWSAERGGSAAASSQLLFDAEYANDCYAAAGLHAQYLVQRGRAPNEQNLAFVLVRQNAVPAGCPELYQPIKRSYRLDAPARWSRDRLAILNVSDAASPRERRLQVAILSLQRHRGPMKGARAVLASGAPVELPLLSQLDVSSKITGTDVVYTLQFTAYFSNACTAATADAVILESRIPAGDGTPDPVFDWLLVTAKDSTQKCATGETSVTRRFKLTQRVRSDYSRVVAVANAVAGAPTSVPTSIVAHRVWPLPVASLSLP